MIILSQNGLCVVELKAVMVTEGVRIGQPIESSELNEMYRLGHYADEAECKAVIADIAEAYRSRGPVYHMPQPGEIWNKHKEGHQS